MNFVNGGLRRRRFGNGHGDDDCVNNVGIHGELPLRRSSTDPVPAIGRRGILRPSYEPISRLDIIAIVSLSAVAIISRFYGISHPAAVVFDELHFQKFVDRHLSNIWYFDIHPPLGKLILAYFGYLLGYRADPSFIIEKIGTEYPSSVNYVALRAVSATFSVATVPMAYLLSRALFISRTASLLAGILVLTDIMGTIEGRLILMDSQLFFFCQLALLSALALWRSDPGTRRRRLLLTTTGLSAGLALSIKHTALATPGLIAIISFFGVHFLNIPLELAECAYAGVIAVATYMAPFYHLLTREWKTGGKYDKFMKGIQGFQKSLIGGELYDPAARRPSFLRMFLYLNRRMIASNASIKKRHTWESTWYQWIVSWRGVLYFSYRGEPDVEGAKGLRSIVYLISNPVVIGVCLLCVTGYLLALCILIRCRALPRPKARNFLRFHIGTGLFLFMGWLSNLIPYILVDRAAFLYHYIPGLFYGQLLSSLLVDMLPPRARATVVAVISCLSVAAYIFWSPWIYAWPLSEEQHRSRRILPKWN